MLYIVFCCFKQEGTQADLIRLDSITSLSPVEEFDPLNVPSQKNHDLPLRASQSNPVYSLHAPQRQTAVPQVINSHIVIAYGLVINESQSIY